MSWKWAQRRRLLARLKAPVISGGDSNSCGGSAHFPVFPRQLRRDAEGGAGSGGVGWGRARRSRDFPQRRSATGPAQVSPTHA